MPNEQATYAGSHKRRIIGKPKLVCEVGQLGILIEIELEMLLHELPRFPPELPIDVLPAVWFIQSIHSCWKLRLLIEPACVGSAPCTYIAYNS